MVPNLTHTNSFASAKTGDQVILKNSGGTIVNSVVCESADPTCAGWSGPPIQPYGGTSVGVDRSGDLGPEEAEGTGIDAQILCRKLDQATGLPVPDTDTAAHWAQDSSDKIGSGLANR
jgi:hypothetical protein